jgi:hypothetical protein
MATELEQALQQSLALMRAHDAPLPLTEGQALAQAMRLRQHGMTYRTIAMVVGTYHGVYYAEDWWRRNLRSRGFPPRHHANGTLRVPPNARRAAR